MPIRRSTKTLIEDEEDWLESAVFGVATALKVNEPRRDGFQVQVAIMFGADPVVFTFVQFGMRLFSNLKVTFDATLTFAVMTIGVR